jgi:hypothetical protein
MSAEAPRTPEVNHFWFLDEPAVTQAVYALCDALGLRGHFKHAENHSAMARALTDYARAAIAARDAEWREAYRNWWNGPKGDDDSAAALRALLSEGKPGQ